MDDELVDMLVDPATLGEVSGQLLGEPLRCAWCGRPLGYSSDDQPAWPGGPKCGECYQAQQADDELMLDMLDT